MIYLQIAAAIAAMLIAAGPALSTLWTQALVWWWERPAGPSQPPIGPNYQDAMQHLASVRLRLVRTESLTKEAIASIEVLTLALMEGSDQ